MIQTVHRGFNSLFRWLDWLSRNSYLLAQCVILPAMNVLFFFLGVGTAFWWPLGVISALGLTVHIKLSSEIWKAEKAKGRVK